MSRVHFHLSFFFFFHTTVLNKVDVIDLESFFALFSIEAFFWKIGFFLCWVWFWGKIDPLLPPPSLSMLRGVCLLLMQVIIFCCPFIALACALSF